ncbi:MAG: hypothetical protein L6455_13860 [Kiritimatiellae bacterium]|nr:hypothetical protein [Kiritimatiellia bacterium]
MNDILPTVKCKKCGNAFQPDMKNKGPWSCPACQAKNPNLKRHYRSVADLCILGLIVTAIIVAVGFSKAGLTLGVILSAGHAILLLVTIIFVYKSRTPWTDATAKALIWTVFGLALVFNVVFPLIFAGTLHIPFIIVYALVFPYLFWLHSQAGKCTAPETPPLTKEQKS